METFRTVRHAMEYFCFGCLKIAFIRYVQEFVQLMKYSVALLVVKSVLDCSRFDIRYSDRTRFELDEWCCLLFQVFTSNVLR